MGELHYIEEAEDHILSELICISCKERFLELRPVRTLLIDLQCPKCKKVGYLIDTGEQIRNETYKKICNENPNLEIYRRIDTFYQGDLNYE